ncbi:MAG TPA: amino acid ABC transporter permease [Casimicrobiaceae bacterium]|nr:amino acid ABC transporter permease [Casimicrobiaceae bacterium]
MSTLSEGNVLAPLTRVPPRAGLHGWLRRHVIATPLDAALAAVLLILAAYALPGAIRWAITDSVVSGDTPSACAGAGGACWAVVTHHARVIVFGLYPYAEQWRAGLALALVALALATTFWLGIGRLQWVAALWLSVVVAFVVLVGGGVFGLKAVPTDEWGGLALSLYVFMLTLVIGFPLAVLLALGRASRLPVLRVVCTGAIEIVRALPILTILFCAAIVVPLMLPQWLTPGKSYRVILAMAFFYACYQAEIIRGGLQGVPSGQMLAALSLGLTPLQCRILVELPQALRYTVPATINQVVVALKDTSMLLVVGLFDFMASANTAISKDEWVRYFTELYLFVAAVFLVLTSVIAALQRRFGGPAESAHGRH